MGITPWPLGAEVDGGKADDASTRIRRRLNETKDSSTRCPACVICRRCTRPRPSSSRSSSAGRPGDGPPGVQATAARLRGGRGRLLVHHLHAYHRLVYFRAADSAFANRCARLVRNQSGCSILAVWRRAFPLQKPPRDHREGIRSPHAKFGPHPPIIVAGHKNVEIDRHTEASHRCGLSLQKSRMPWSMWILR